MQKKQKQKKTQVQTSILNVNVFIQAYLLGEGVFSLFKKQITYSMLSIP